MVVKAVERIAEIRENMRGGDGAAQIMHILPGDAKPANCRLFAQIKLAPGASIGRHGHQSEAEVFYITSGKALVEDGGITVTLEQGDSLVTSNGEHSIRNAGDDDLEFLAAIILE